MPPGVQEKLPGGPHGWVSGRRRAEAAGRGVNGAFVLYAGKLCIEVTPQSKIVWISESLCIGCGICIKVAEPTAGISGRVFLFDGFCFLTFACSRFRNVRSERCPSSTFPAIWRKKPPTDTAPTPSNCTGTLSSGLQMEELGDNRYARDAPLLVSGRYLSNLLGSVLVS